MPRSAPPFPSPLHSFGLSDHLPIGPVAAPAQRRIKWSGWANARSGRELRQWKNLPHPPPHQYCSFTWWKLILANIFHLVTRREDQMPPLDMPTLLPVQTVTQSSFNYSWFFRRGREVWRDLKAGDVKESNYQQEACVCCQLPRWEAAETRTWAPPGATGWQDWLKPKFRYPTVRFIIFYRWRPKYYIKKMYCDFLSLQQRNLIIEHILIMSNHKCWHIKKVNFTGCVRL